MAVSNCLSLSLAFCTPCTHSHWLDHDCRACLHQPDAFQLHLAAGTSPSGDPQINCTGFEVQMMPVPFQVITTGTHMIHAEYHCEGTPAM